MALRSIGRRAYINIFAVVEELGLGPLAHLIKHFTVMHDVHEQQAGQQ